MLKAIIFDVDGVLVDSMPFQADAWIEAFSEVGISITRKDIYEIEGSNNKRLIKSIFEKAGKKLEPWHLEQLPEKKREALDFDQIKPFDGIKDCLKELKRHFKLAMVSGSHADTIDKIVNKFFSNYFDVIITGSDLERGKPAPDPYLKALEKLEIAKNECIVIENAPLGITAAKRAGIYCVAIASTLEPEKIQHADLVFNDHSALLDYLKSLIIE
jgi:beta-phosphoglucomutase